MLRLFEGVGLLLLLVLIISQIVLPFSRGTRFFPSFRRRTPLAKTVDSAEKVAVDVTELAEAQEAIRAARDRVDEAAPRTNIARPRKPPKT